MSYEDVIDEIGNLSVNELVQKYSKSELINFYKSLFGIESRCSFTKSDLAYHCWNYIADDKRTRDLCKILR